MPRVLHRVLAALLTVGAGLVAAPAAHAGTSPVQRTVDAVSTLRWGACPTGAPAPQECATLQVPLDYRHPHGRAISVEVSRIPAADPGKRKGVLMLNGGGPSAGLDVPASLGALLPAEVRDRYDLVAFDPRGIGYSTPMSCGRGADELIRDVQLSLLSFPAADGSIGANVSFAKRMAKQCAANSGDLLRHITTANVARDMDRIRRALGERTVSYYGLSWGTYLGSLYRALFPRTVDRMVLDSSVDPYVRGYDDFRTFSVALEDRWPDLAAFGVANAGSVRLGTTARQVRKNYLALTAQLDRHPVMLTETLAPINGNFVRLFTWLLSYNDAALIATEEEPLPQMAQLWRAAGAVAAGHATSADRAFLAGLANGLVAGGTLPNVPQDNLLSVGWAYSCGDKAWPRNVGTYARNVAADRAAFPLTAGAPANVAPCSAWAVQPAGPEPAVEPIGRRDVLILQNERDPSTPLNGARGMRRAMGSDAVLVTVDAGGHGVLIHPKPNACAIGALTSYLTTGALPATDKACA
ncbi:hydrolase [Paractinoplanes abujensis]|uniref:Pimeloyl-ACP methyl ester carboxylesterase n=1 Tax=Paractinoplanes abujensis TaxID=882441 RepID=A0A7W7CRL6_9ACTN|nr:alpha/beta hydrolase [Actinoplanes abujensis]MBB4693450.1 pimeloyl-ACP methyl ester carboxylesterase [Actinoplanes abujensis]GID21890.1 hydrolase [Actinoplanes abujensis]